LKTSIGEFIVKDQDFKLFPLPKGEWEKGAEARAQHKEEMERLRVENLKTFVGEAGRRKPRPTAQIPPGLVEGRTDLDWDIELEPEARAKDRKFKHIVAKPPPKPRVKRK
jgi:hypothetical protein